MDFYIDVSDEAFDALHNHTTDILSLPASLDSGFQTGDSLKLYHPSNPAEALRVLIVEKKEENDATVTLHCSLLEWVFQIETELDDLLREEEKLYSDFLSF